MFFQVLLGGKSIAKKCTACNHPDSLGIYVILHSRSADCVKLNRTKDKSSKLSKGHRYYYMNTYMCTYVYIYIIFCWAFRVSICCLEGPLTLGFGSPYEYVCITSILNHRTWTWVDQVSVFDILRHIPSILSNVVQICCF